MCLYKTCIAPVPPMYRGCTCGESLLKQVYIVTINIYNTMYYFLYIYVVLRNNIEQALL